MFDKLDKDFIVELIKLIKPEFYNKLTWTMVIAGIALLSTPLWQDIVVAALDKYLGLNVSLAGSPIWGFGLIIIGLVYHFVTNSLLKFMHLIKERDAEDNQKTHDTKIFKASDEKINEQQLYNFFSRLTGEHAYWFEESNKIDDLTHFLSGHENTYLTTEIKDQASIFIQNLEKLMVFVATHFVVFPREQQGGNPRLCMHPDGNWDRVLTVSDEDSRLYDELSGQLNDLVRQAREGYIAYRKSVKENLFI